MNHKIIGECHAARLMVHVSKNNTLKTIYNPLFHSIIKCGIIFGVTHPTVEIFTLKRKIIRIIACAQLRTSCPSLFKQLEILPVPCQYIF